MVRKIAILADAALRATLAEQFARAPDFTLADLSETLPPNPGEWPDALVIAGDDADVRAETARRQGFPGPIVLIVDTPQAPGPAADFALTRPLRFADLLAALDTNPLRIGPYRLLGENLVCGETATLRLTEKEAAILRRLARTPGASVTRDVLLRDVWGYAPGVATRTLETHIHRLRRKLERDPRQPRWLVTTAAGYHLAPPGTEDI